jgi:hypothetical protein
MLGFLRLVTLSRMTNPLSPAERAWGVYRDYL